MLHAALLARRAATSGTTVFAPAQATRALASKAPPGGGARKAKILAAAANPPPPPSPKPNASHSSSAAPSEKPASSTPPPIVEQPVAERVPNPADASTEQPVPVPPSNLKSLDFTSLLDTPQVQAPAGASGEGGRTGARSSQGSLSSIERKRRMLARATMLALGIGLGAAAVNLGNEWETEELRAKKMVRGPYYASVLLLISF